MTCLQRNEFGKAFEKNGHVWHGEGHTVVKDAPANDGARKANEMYSLTGLPPIYPVSRHQQVVATSVIRPPSRAHCCCSKLATLYAEVMMIVIVIASLASLAFAGLKTIGSGENKQFDVSEFPADMKAKYDIMKIKCIKCHTLERVAIAITTGVAPISGQPFDKKSTKEYGIKMMRKPSSNMSKDETMSVVKLLDFMLDEAAK